MSFQFLMVRLKGYLLNVCKRINGISIPYGAIKRKGYRGCHKTLLLFQFLMVRLKEKLRRLVKK